MLKLEIKALEIIGQNAEFLFSEICFVKDEDDTQKVCKSLINEAYGEDAEILSIRTLSEADEIEFTLK